MVLRGIEFPDAVARCLDPSAAPELRRQIARGAVPLPPLQRVASLAILLTDPEEATRAEARAALESLPETFLAEAVAEPSLPEFGVDAVAEVCQERRTLLWSALGHPKLGRQTVERLLGASDPEVVSRLAQNQRFFDRHPELGRQLLTNPLLHPSERSRLTFLYGSPEDEPITVPLEDVPLPQDLPAALLDDSAEPDGTAEGSQNLYQLVQAMSVAEKIKLAMLGSKGARRLLIRDTNKLVAVAVIRSPKIREDEVVVIAQDRTVADEVVRIILNRKDWLKSYPLRLALAQNPKTPIPRALRLLETLQEKDLRQIAKSRNVQGAVSTGAVRVLARRGKT